MRYHKVLISLYLISAAVGLFAVISLVGLAVVQTGLALPGTFIVATIVAVICLRLARPDAFRRVIDLLVYESDHAVIETEVSSPKPDRYSTAFEYHPGTPETLGFVRVLVIDHKHNDVVHASRLSERYIMYDMRGEGTEVAMASFGIQQTLRPQIDTLSLPRLGSGRHARAREDRTQTRRLCGVLCFPIRGLLLSCLPFRYMS